MTGASQSAVPVPRRVTVAVVMPVRNEEDEVETTLAAVFASTRAPDEIIVADGMSTDRTVERVRAFARAHDRAVTIVENPTLWCGGGRNRAIEQTRCDVIVLADFGNILDPDYIARMVAPFERDETVDIVGSVFRLRVDSDFEHCVAGIHYFDNYTLERYSAAEREALLSQVVAPGGNSIAFTRAIWMRLGGYPEWLARAQDKMFSRKAHAVGAKVAVAWDAVVRVHVRRTPRQLFRQLLLYGRGYGQSHYVSAHSAKLTVLYGAVLGLLAGTVASPWIGTAGLALYAGYVAKAGPWKVYRAAPEKFRAIHLAMAPVALVCRDAGSILGHFYGWGEWLFDPRYRRQFVDYTRDAPAHRLHRLAR